MIEILTGFIIDDNLNGVSVKTNAPVIIQADILNKDGSKLDRYKLGYKLGLNNFDLSAVAVSERAHSTIKIQNGEELVYINNSDTSHSYELAASYKLTQSIKLGAIYYSDIEKAEPTIEYSFKAGKFDLVSELSESVQSVYIKLEL